MVIIDCAYSGLCYFVWTICNYLEARESDVSQTNLLVMRSMLRPEDIYVGDLMA